MTMVEDLVSDCANVSSPNHLALNLGRSRAGKRGADLYANLERTCDECSGLRKGGCALEDLPRFN